MNDGSRLGDRPEAVAKHEQVGHEPEHSDPNQRRNSDGGAVGAGEHQTRSLESVLELEARAMATRLAIPPESSSRWRGRTSSAFRPTDSRARRTRLRISSSSRPFTNCRARDTFSSTVPE